MWPIIAPNPPFRQVFPMFLIMNKPPLMFPIRNTFQKTSHKSKSETRQGRPWARDRSGQKGRTELAGVKGPPDLLAGGTTHHCFGALFSSQHKRPLPAQILF